jgi:hypothetical protein
MTSSSSDHTSESLRPPALAGAVGLLATVVAAGGACRQPDVIDTTAEFVRPSDTGGFNTCTGPNNGPLGRMDTYVVELYDVETTGLGETAMDCQTCIGTAGDCVMRHQPMCTCGSSIPADWQSLGPQLQGTRIEGLDQTDIYCMRVIAIDRGATTEPGPTEPCVCDPKYMTSDFLSTQARLCALGPPRPVSPLRISLEVRCEGDVLPPPGSGGRNRNIASFQDCITPPAPM